jgi:hypothetical protein
VYEDTGIDRCVLDMIPQHAWFLNLYIIAQLHFTLML